MFTQLLDQHFVHTALWAGAVVAVVSGAIGVFVVARGMSFAVHAISELGFTGAAGALVLGIDPVLGILGGSVLVGLVLGLLSLRGRERDSAIGAVLAFGLGLGVLFLSLYQGYATEATNLLFGSIVGVSDAQLRNLAIVAAVVLAGLVVLYRPLLFSSDRPGDRRRARRAAARALGGDLPAARADDGRGDPGGRRPARADARDHACRGGAAADRPAGAGASAQRSRSRSSRPRAGSCSRSRSRGRRASSSARSRSRRTSAPAWSSGAAAGRRSAAGPSSEQDPAAQPSRRAGRPDLDNRTLRASRKERTRELRPARTARSARLERDGGGAVGHAVPLGAVPLGAGRPGPVEECKAGARSLAGIRNIAVRPGLTRSSALTETARPL